MEKEISELDKIDAVEQIIKSKIYIIRGHKVMLDKDLAELYGVTTGNLNLAIRRNASRFPIDFMFQIDTNEFQSLILQFARSKRGGSRHLPYAFTEHGVSMLSSVLNSEKAIEMSIFIIRVFIKIKEWILSNEELRVKVGEIERKQKEQGDLLNSVNSVVTQLVEKPIKAKTKIGFNNQT